MCLYETGPKKERETQILQYMHGAAPSKKFESIFRLLSARFLFAIAITEAKQTARIWMHTHQKKNPIFGLCMYAWIHSCMNAYSIESKETQYRDQRGLLVYVCMDSLMSECIHAYLPIISRSSFRAGSRVFFDALGHGSSLHARTRALYSIGFPPSNHQKRPNNSPKEIQ